MIWIFGIGSLDSIGLGLKDQCTYPFLEEALGGGWQAGPDIAQDSSGLEGFEPDDQTDDHGEETRDGGEVSAELQPSSRQRH